MSRSLLPACLLLGSSLAFGAGVDSDFELREGYVDSASGMKVEKVYDNPETGFQEVVVSMPGSSDRIETVVVTAPRIKKSEPAPLLHSWEFVDNMDGERDGVILRLGKGGNSAVHLKLDSTSVDPGAIFP